MSIISEKQALWSSANALVNAKKEELKIDSFSYYNHSARAEAQSAFSDYCKQQNIPEEPHWRDMIAKPVIEAVAGHLGLKGIRVEGPFGTRARLHVRLFNTAEEADFNDKNFMIDFNLIPENLSRDEGRGTVLSVMDFSQYTKRYSNGTVGEKAGLNFGFTALPDDASIETISDIIIKCTPDHKINIAA